MFTCATHSTSQDQNKVYTSRPWATFTTFRILPVLIKLDVPPCLQVLCHVSNEIEWLVFLLQGDLIVFTLLHYMCCFVYYLCVWHPVTIYILFLSFRFTAVTRTYPCHSWTLHKNDIHFIRSRVKDISRFHFSCGCSGRSLKLYYESD